jgi:hypothetical protein
MEWHSGCRSLEWFIMFRGNIDGHFKPIYNQNHSQEKARFIFRKAGKRICEGLYNEKIILSKKYIASFHFDLFLFLLLSLYIIKFIYYVYIGSLGVPQAYSLKFKYFARCFVFSVKNIVQHRSNRWLYLIHTRTSLVLSFTLFIKFKNYYIAVWSCLLHIKKYKFIKEIWKENEKKTGLTSLMYHLPMKALSAEKHQLDVERQLVFLNTFQSTTKNVNKPPKHISGEKCR